MTAPVIVPSPLPHVLPVVTEGQPARPLTHKDFASDVEVRWCPGCVDYVVLNQLQKLLPSLGVPKENFVFVSGIGCSSRLPYYLDTYGVHGIHGRAPAIATGIKLVRPELSVWVVTGDGDSLAIGGNHLMHALRRNIGIKILLLNNRIYGLTKGQTSPASPMGTRTKSTPEGSLEQSADPVKVALGAGATFVARVLGNDAKMLTEVLKRAAAHPGTTLVEILQNCVIFNDGAFDDLTAPAVKEEAQLRLAHGKPLQFGKGGDKGITFVDGAARVVKVADVPPEQLLVHDERNEFLSLLESRLGAPDFPMPLGIFRDVPREPFEALVHAQLEPLRDTTGTALRQLLDGDESWEVR